MQLSEGRVVCMHGGTITCRSTLHAVGNRISPLLVSSDAMLLVVWCPWLFHGAGARWRYVVSSNLRQLGRKSTPDTSAAVHCWQFEPLQLAPMCAA